MTAPFYSVQNQNDFQRNLANGRPNDWQCGAGGRYLYICEDGLVHWCSQQRGYPAIPLTDYTIADVEREATSEKSCARLCTVSCVHRVSLIDRLRGPAHGDDRRDAAGGGAGTGQRETPPVDVRNQPTP